MFLCTMLRRILMWRTVKSNFSNLHYEKSDFLIVVIWIILFRFVASLLQQNVAVCCKRVFSRKYLEQGVDIES